MPGVERADIDRMTGSLFIDGGAAGRASTRFWTLLVLAAIIATAGLVADSTATVIGAMIVAPLMTPILGTALSLVLADRRHVLSSIGHVVLGAVVVIAIGVAIGLIHHPADDYASNAQISARISPRLIDLVAALATGTVGAFALVRSDISDTLPGVAIAISLVPPLAVVGLLVSVARYEDAAHAGLLFATNVAAIIATGVAVLWLYRVRATAEMSGLSVGILRGRAIVPVVLFVAVVAVPLAAGSASIARDEQLAAQARPVAEDWASAEGWQAIAIDAVHGEVHVEAIGPPPQIEVEPLRQALDAAGMADADLSVHLVVGGEESCPADGPSCESGLP
jgi:uncharacterized hydrophobic protein (TIGR00271 family)